MARSVRTARAARNPFRRAPQKISGYVREPFRSRKMFQAWAAGTWLAALGFTVGTYRCCRRQTVTAANPKQASATKPCAGTSGITR